MPSCDRTYVLSRDKIKALAIDGQRFAMISAELIEAIMLEGIGYCLFDLCLTQAALARLMFYFYL